MGIVKKVLSKLKKIGPAIQGNNYGSGYNVGGTTVKETNSAGGPVQGPVQQGKSESTFRTTGKSVDVTTNPVSVSAGTNPETLKPSKSGGGGSPSKSSNKQSTILTPTQGATVNQQNTKQTSSSSLVRALNKINKPRTNLNNLSTVKLMTSGEVKVGNKGYVGNSYVKELGMTANQYNATIRKKLIDSGQLEKKNSGQGRFSVETKTGEETLDNGEVVIYNNLGEPVGVKSKFFGQSMSIENYDKKINEIINNENKVYGNTLTYGNNPGTFTTITKEGIAQYYRDGKKKGKSYQIEQPKFYKDGSFSIGNSYYDSNGKFLAEAGGVIPVTPEDVTTIAMGGAGLAKLGVKKGLTFALSGLITKPVNILYEKTYQPKTNVGKFAKAATTGLVITRFPTLGEAYLADITKAVIMQPKQLVTSAVKNPAETLGFAVGGNLLERGFNLAELQFRGIKVEKVNLPNYGEVFIQKIPKYKDIVWVKGAFSQTEKVGVMEQINRLKGNKERVFVQVSPKGVPRQVFSNTKNLGFEVKEVSNPMRGLYQAPPFKFLENYKDLINTNYGAASYYASGSRRSILPNPFDLLRSKVTDTFSNQRPFEYIERTYKEVKTPKWIEETAKSLEQGRGIPKQYNGLINKLYKEFLDKPIDFQGKLFKGLEKEKLLNYMNLKSKGNGVKLKVYSALLEFQNKNKVRLAGGAENLSGINPYGAEHQIVRALGTRFFEKSIKDLRKGVKPTIRRSIVEFITGTKRGQKVAMIEGQMVEIQPVRSFDKSIKGKTNVKLEKFKPKDVSEKLVDSIIGEKRPRQNIPVPRPFLQRTNVRNENIKNNRKQFDRRNRSRIDNLLIPRREPIRIENRPRVNVRNVPRRYEPRKTIELPRFLREQSRQPRERTPRERIKERPFNYLIGYGNKGKPRRNKNINKKENFRTQRTAFDLLTGKKGIVTQGEISGFESSRIA